MTRGAPAVEQRRLRNGRAAVQSTYGDGAMVAFYANSRVMSCTAYILLSLQMGGWDGNGTHIDPVLDPAYMDVDYVKVWSGTKN